MFSTCGREGGRAGVIGGCSQVSHVRVVMTVSSSCDEMGGVNFSQVLKTVNLLLQYIPLSTGKD